MSGNGLAQIIGLVIITIITPYFEPSEMGVLGMYLAIAGWIGVIAALRYDLAIMLPKSNDDAKRLVKISIKYSLIVAIIAAIPIYIFNYDIAVLLNSDNQFDSQELANWFYLIPISIFLYGYNAALTTWQTRKKKYSTVSAASVGRSVSTGGTNLTAAFAKLGSGALIGAALLGQLVNGIILAVKGLKEVLATPSPAEDRKRLMKEYKDFPLKSGPAIFLNLSANQLPTLLIGGWFGAAVAGQFYIMQRILTLPLTFIGKAFSQVFYQKSNEIINNGGSVRPLVAKTTLRLFAIITIPMVVLFFFGDSIFELVLGSKYKEAGSIGALFSVFYLFRFVFSAQSTLLTTKRKLTTEIIFNASFLVTQVGSLWYGHHINDYNFAFQLMAVSGAALFLILGVLIFKYAGDK